MSHTKVSLDAVEPRDVEGVDPALRAVGYELQPSEMRPNVWEFDAGDATNRHRQGEQEELYVVLDGRLRMDVEGEAFEVTAGDHVVVPPESWRRLVAEEESRVLVVGAPNVPDDGILEDDADT
ncbi:MAG: cupin domain-containing protein [Haloferacaceae archaeon]